MGEAKRKMDLKVNGYVACCMNCDAWERKSAGNKLGHCRALPPVVLVVPQPQQVQTPNGPAMQFVPVADSFWPITGDFHWCRAHKAAVRPALADKVVLEGIGPMENLQLEETEGNAD